MGASVAPALILRAERHVVEYLRAHKATSPDRAVPFPPDASFIQERRFERLVTAQVIQQGSGGYWLDESMYRGFQSDRRALALVIAAIVTTTAIGMAIVSVLT